MDDLYTHGSTLVHPVYIDCKDGQHNSLQQPSQDIVQEYVDQAQIQRAACFWTFVSVSVTVVAFLGATMHVQHSTHLFFFLVVL